MYLQVNETQASQSFDVPELLTNKLYPKMICSTGKSEIIFKRYKGYHKTPFLVFSCTCDILKHFN